MHAGSVADHGDVTPGFDAFPGPGPVENICMFGICSVNPAERAALTECEIEVNDMHLLDEQGVVAPLRAFLEPVVRKANRLFHVSLDVDFLAPSIARAVGTTFREAHLVCEMLHEPGLVASLMGHKVFDHPTRSFA